MDFAIVLMLFDVSDHREYLKSFAVVFHLCTTVLEDIIFNMAASMAAKIAKFILKLCFYIRMLL